MPSLGLPPLALLSLLTTLHGWRPEPAGGARRAFGASRWPAVARSAPVRSLAVLVDGPEAQLVPPPTRPAAGATAAGDALGASSSDFATDGALARAPAPLAADDAAAADADAAAAAAASAADSAAGPAGAGAEPAPPDGLSAEPLERAASASGLRRRVIKRGDFVVHRDLGVCRFAGVGTVTATARRFLLLQFANAELELPTAQQGILSLYRRADEALLRPVRLSSTGRVAQWRAKKARARKSLEALTVGILEAYRDRARLSRARCAPDGAAYAAFVGACAFELTADQASACAAVAADMTERPQPMDRLICGDVGFGKTEVAMRAIFRACANGRQAAVLAPTTVLAWQHHATMRARMPALRVGLLTRLTPPKAARALIEAIGAGEVDVIVGTHSLLSKRVRFHNLGLMVVDEEHRFGVNQKEKVKALAAHIDFLTMSATPIPRTLSLGLSALRDMSILNTPPPGRRPVRTVCEAFSARAVRAAIGAELARGGQAFYVVPRISQIEPALQLLAELFPGAAVEYAHGQCADLEARMLRFADGAARVLVSTSVVECGIDMPRVNTLVVQDAHMFGLASLHQLRGRVGRSSTQAHAFLLSRETAMLTAEAGARLRALREFSALGDGFELAQADMALRGCGNLLGPEQSGQVNDVGAEFFFEMLEEAIATARARADEPKGGGGGGEGLDAAREEDDDDADDDDDDEVDADLDNAAAWRAEADASEDESDEPPSRR